MGRKSAEINANEQTLLAPSSILVDKFCSRKDRLLAHVCHPKCFLQCSRYPSDISFSHPAWPGES